MPSLSHTLSVGSEALFASRQGVDTTGHNIANAQTEGYSRQRVNLTTREPLERQGLIIGNGAFIKNISRAHDRFVERQLNTSKQETGRAVGKSEALLGIEQIFNTTASASISDEMTSFFNALQNLASYPEEVATRTSVQEAAQDLTSAFRRVDFQLQRQKGDLDQQLGSVSQQINDVVGKIARLNDGILAQEIGGSSEANDLRDQQELLVRNLSEKMDVETYLNQHGALVVRGPADALLVDGNYSAHVETKRLEDGRVGIVVGDGPGGLARDITDHINGGQIASIIEVRDQVITQLQDENSNLAKTIVDQVNKVHRRGYGLGDFAETTGRDFFSYDGEPSAANIKVNDAIAENAGAISVAASPRAPGDNILVNDILRLRNDRLLNNGSMTFNEYYANTVSKLGLEVERSNAAKEANEVVLGDLEKRREAVSGVSLDEEAVNLLRWQTAFAASSKLITTIDEMFETVLALKR